MKAADARVVLTGAGGGIGQEVAVALLEAGAAVMLVGRSPTRLATLARSLASRSGGKGDAGAAARVAWQATDLLGDLAPLAEAATAWQGNVLVHAAGVPAFGRLQALAPQQIRGVLETNLLAPMLLSQALLPHLLRRPRAQVICVGSALGRIGLPGFTAYSASKFGLRGFAEALRRELADTAVRVQYLGPRSTRTGFNDAGVEAYNRATGTAMDSPRLVARALLALLENERPERFLGFPETLAVRINGLAASWLDGAFARHRDSLPALPSPAETP